MRSLSASELLEVWERGLNQHPIQRALTLLTAACPGVPFEDLATLSIGQRDARLLTLREWLFGSQVQSLVACPACGDRLELSFSLEDIRQPIEPVDVLLLKLADYEVQCRLPNSSDLIAIATEFGTDPAMPSTDATSSELRLLRRCLLAVSQQGAEQSWEQLPPAVITQIVQHMATADAQAEIQIDLTCPSCGHQWRSVFDIVSFLWAEIHTWAERTLLEVHILASAYSWREQDILAMSPLRRQLYLEMVQ